MPFAAVNDTELYYERHGDGHPIVCCHGDGRDHRAWMPQIEGLSDEFELIVYDLNGYGKSGGSTRNEQSYSVHADDLHALIETLDLTAPTVVGWSMGGRVAYTYAARHPTHLASLVLLEPAIRNFPAPPLPLKPVAYILPTLGNLVGWTTLINIQKRISNFRGNEDPRRGNTIQGLGLSKAEYHADVEGQIDNAAYSKMMVSIRSEIFSDDEPDVDFADIDVPVLALTGEDPRDSYVQTLSALSEAVDHVWRETIADAGHDAQIDNPEAFNRLLRDFIDQSVAEELMGSTTRTS
jgi:pimeloyl-ACP methyl ester carboxylesterase